MPGPPLTALTALAVGSVDLPMLTSAVTAAVGLFVAYQAYRGYRRNRSAPMLYLAIGIFLVTTGSVVATYALALAGATDALVILGMTALDILGLSAILYALTGA